MGALNYQMDKIKRLERRKLELDQVPRSDPRFAGLDFRVSELEKKQYIVLGESLRELNQKIDEEFCGMNCIKASQSFWMLKI